MRVTCMSFFLFAVTLFLFIANLLYKLPYSTLHYAGVRGYIDKYFELKRDLNLNLPFISILK